MIAVSGVMYRIFSNVLKDLVTDWCVKKGKIPDTQFGFFPGRSTLLPLFILRHHRHAAKKLKPGNSPRLHVWSIYCTLVWEKQVCVCGYV